MAERSGRAGGGRGGSRRRTAARKAEVVIASSTEVQNAFGRFLDIAARGGTVKVLKRDVPAAVLISSEEYDALTGGVLPDLEALTAEFDALVARLQGRAARRALRQAFSMSDAELARVAVEAARTGRE
jgi:prevent-host-death family protein